MLDRREQLLGYSHARRVWKPCSTFGMPKRVRCSVSACLGLAFFVEIAVGATFWLFSATSENNLVHCHVFGSMLVMCAFKLDRSMFGGYPRERFQPQTFLMVRVPFRFLVARSERISLLLSFRCCKPTCWTSSSGCNRCLANWSPTRPTILCCFPKWLPRRSAFYRAASL